MKENLWSFETKNYRIDWTISPDFDVDLSWDDTGEAADKLNSGEWVCFCSEVTVTHKPTGIEIGSDFLGGSIYADPKEFRDHFGMNGKGRGSYFSDTVRSAIADARINLAKLR